MSFVYLCYVYINSILYNEAISKTIIYQLLLMVIIRIAIIATSSKKKESVKFHHKAESFISLCDCHLCEICPFDI